MGNDVIVHSSPHRRFHLAQPVGRLEDLAGFGAVCGADDAVALHHVDQVGGAAVADAQAALQQGSRSLAELEHQPHSVFVQLVVAVSIFRAGLEIAALVVFGSLEEAFDVFSLALLLPEIDHRRRLFLGDEGSVDALHARGSRRQEEHIAAA